MTVRVRGRRRLPVNELLLIFYAGSAESVSFNSEMYFNIKFFFMLNGLLYYTI